VKEDNQEVLRPAVYLKKDEYRIVTTKQYIAKHNLKLPLGCHCLMIVDEQLISAPTLRAQARRAYVLLLFLNTCSDLYQSGQ